MNGSGRKSSTIKSRESSANDGIRQVAGYIANRLETFPEVFLPGVGGFVYREGDDG